jgi:hypothetical protein
MLWPGPYRSQEPFDPETQLFYDLAAKRGLGRYFRSPLAATGSKERLQWLLEDAGWEQAQVGTALMGASWVARAGGQPRRCWSSGACGT